MRIFKISTRDQRAQIQIAGAVLHQHRHAGRVIAIQIVGDPQIAADDRLDAAFARRQIKAHRTEHVGAVGQRQRALPVRRRLGDRVVDSHDAVDDRKLRMQAKMDKLRAAHRYDFAIAVVRKLWITDRWRQLPRILQRNLWNALKYRLPNPFVSRDERLSLSQWRYNIPKETACSD